MTAGAPGETAGKVKLEKNPFLFLRKRALFLRTADEIAQGTELRAAELGAMLRRGQSWERRAAGTGDRYGFTGQNLQLTFQIGPLALRVLTSLFGSFTIALQHGSGAVRKGDRRGRL